MWLHIIPSVLSLFVIWLIYRQFKSERGNNIWHPLRGLAILFLVFVVILLNISSFEISWDIPWMIHFVPGVVFFLGMTVLLVTGLYSWLSGNKIWRGHRITAIITTTMFGLSLLGAMIMPLLRR